MSTIKDEEPAAESEEEEEEDDDEENDTDEGVDHVPAPDGSSSDQERVDPAPPEPVSSPTASNIPRESPPLSHSSSALSLAEDARDLTLEDRGHADLVKERVLSDASRAYARQQRKYHTKRSAQRAGRAKGSKAKQDPRVKLDRSSGWD